MESEEQPSDQHGGEVDQPFEDVEAADMKALRAWMFNVQSYLHRNGAIDSEQKQELMDLAQEATGWNPDE